MTTTLFTGIRVLSFWQNLKLEVDCVQYDAGISSKNIYVWAGNKFIYPIYKMKKL